MTNSLHTTIRQHGSPTGGIYSEGINTLNSSTIQGSAHIHSPLPRPPPLHHPPPPRGLLLFAKSVEGCVGVVGKVKSVALLAQLEWTDDNNKAKNWVCDVEPNRIYSIVPKR